MTSWSWLGDHLALDVANTMRWRDECTRVELWNTPEDLVTWLDAEPVELPRPLDVTPEEWRSLRELRDAIVDLLQAATLDERLPEEAVRLVNEIVHETGTTRLLAGRVGEWSTRPAATDPLAALRGHLAAAVVDLLSRDDLANLTRCHAPDCGQFFHRSRPNQRWCSPGCGNRARVDRHRHRSKIPPPQENS